MDKVKFSYINMICETQMPPMMTNSKDSQDHKDKYLNTGRKILLLDNEAV